MKSSHIIKLFIRGNVFIGMTSNCVDKYETIYNIPTMRVMLESLAVWTVI